MDNKESAGQVSSENIGEYFNRLSNHDWYYDYSDDHSVWKRGSANRDRLLNTAAEHPTYKEMYNEFVNWMRANRERPVVTEFYDEV